MLSLKGTSMLGKVGLWGLSELPFRANDMLSVIFSVVDGLCS
jgi:hypothetical protein